MGLLKSGWMQPVVEESTAADSEAETDTQSEPGAKALISDIPDDAFGHVLFWLPPLTNLAAARVAKQWRVRVAKFFSTLLQPRSAGTRRSMWLRSGGLRVAQDVAVARSDRNSSVLPPQLRRYVHAYLRFR